MREDLARLGELIRENNVSLILMGNPVHMSGQEGRQSDYSRTFGERLKAFTGVDIKLWDERLTTGEAHRVLRDSVISLQKRDQAVDRWTGVILLESYLDSLRP